MWWLVLFLSVCAAVLFLRRVPPRPRVWCLLLGLLVLVPVVLWIRVPRETTLARKYRTFETAAAWTLARELVSNAAATTGDVVVVQFHGRGPRVDEAARYQRMGVDLALQGTGLRPVYTGPDFREMDAAWKRRKTMEGWTPEDIRHWLASSPAPIALISFIGLPPFFPDDRPPPPLYLCVADRERYYGRLMRQGHLRALVRPHENLSKNVDPSTIPNLQEIFDLRYTLVKANENTPPQKEQKPLELPSGSVPEDGGNPSTDSEILASSPS